MEGRAVCRGDEVLMNRVKLIEVDGVEIGLVRTGAFVVAFENVCPHQGGPVCYGEVLGQVEIVLDGEKRIVGERFSDEHLNLICPWHGWSFDVRTGECITDRKVRLRRWSAEERNGLVYVLGRGSQASGIGETR